ncbi:hypothetical protein [Lacipirellula parvula]|uniref:Uncharacterized protein n=1 Tax=Lacipirellula parvula TaxID=2650471 RepID=A0A5K7XEW3_9BACT|nr:hypothetical protein [Lacipirellula parvula]BBO35340.1 hypothetical protein PLANPX_4952 [Lacipirellula parvula]
MKRMLFSLLAVAVLGVASQSAQAQWVVQPTTVWSPVVMPAPVMQPMVVQSAPVFAPMPVTTFYRAPVVTMAPVPQVVTRYRPILGGSVSRVRYGWAPVAF